MMYSSVAEVCLYVLMSSCCVNCLPAEVAETPQKSPVDAVLETKDNFGFDFIERKFISALNPRPIVDTMLEHEKYGNTQDHPIGKAVVKGVEKVSNLVNSAFSLPENAVKQGSRKLTDFLDNLGGKLVGLQ